MDKSKIAVIVIGVVMAVLLIYVMCISGNTTGLTKNQLMQLGDTIYTVEDAKKYILIANEEDGDIAKELDETEIESVLNEYITEKTYAIAAKQKGVMVPTEELEEFKSEYAEKTALAQYGVTEEDYIKYASDEYMSDEIKQNFGKYYKLDEEIYNEVVAGAEEPLKSYAFRIMTFYYEEAEEADVVAEDAVAEDVVSEDVNEEVTEEEHEHEEETADRTRDAVYAEAVEVRNKVLAGEDFGELAKEHSSYRYTFNGSTYTLINGDIEYATSLLLEDKLGSELVYNAVKDLGAGECSELIEDEESDVITLVKIESIEDGFTGEADEELREILLYQQQDVLVSADVHAHLNQSALLRVYYK